MTAAIIEAHDVAFFDLDGVIYLGPVAVPGAVPGIEAVKAAGARVMYVTNNAARSAVTVAEHLNGLGFPAGPDAVALVSGGTGTTFADLAAGDGDGDGTGSAAAEGTLGATLLRTARSLGGAGGVVELRG